jgi:hypothetical protein
MNRRSAVARGERTVWLPRAQTKGAQKRPEGGAEQGWQDNLFLLVQFQDEQKLLFLPRAQKFLATALNGRFVDCFVYSGRLHLP